MGECVAKGDGLNVLVTGANGFIGTALIRGLVDASRYNIIGTVRKHSDVISTKVEFLQYGDLTEDTDWIAALDGVEVVVHLAARVHIVNDASLDSLADFRRVNVDGTLNLARQAAATGAKRFIYLSSIKVNGELTQPGHPFTEIDPPDPQGAYGISKFEAEEGLRHLAAETGLAVTIIRPPLVYGPGVKGNFYSLINLVKSGVPIPLGAIENRRSLLALGNLIDFILLCIEHPKAVNQTFLLTDGEDLSTKELLTRIGSVLGRRVRLISMPSILLKLGATLIGRKAIFQRLCGSLQVDSSKACSLLDWSPPIHVDEGLRRTVKEGSR